VQYYCPLQYPANTKHKHPKQQHLDDVACQAAVVIMRHYLVLQLVCEMEQTVGDEHVHCWQQQQQIAATAAAAAAATTRALSEHFSNPSAAEVGICALAKLA
jgi:hypothetical protein